MTKANSNSKLGKTNTATIGFEAVMNLTRRGIEADFGTEHADTKRAFCRRRKLSTLIDRSRPVGSTAYLLS